MEAKGIVSSTELETLLKQLIDTLENERRCMSYPNSEYLPTLIDKKRDLLQRLAGIPQSLIDQLGNAKGGGADDPALDRIQKLLDKCKEYNKDNGVLAAQSLKVCRSTMDLLGSRGGMVEVEVYDKKGFTDAPTRSRFRGTA